jgi:catechol O-methyltransferase
MSAPSRTLLSSAAVAATTGLLATRARGPLRVALGAGAGVALAVTANEAAGKPVPFLRWSFLRIIVHLKRVMTEWQVGDGREEALAAYVVENAQKGDIDDVLRVIDDYSRNQAYLINVGDEKGEILDAAVRKAAPSLILELGTYCGYGALRLARSAPAARVYSVELIAANADIARRVLAHAGVGDRVTVVVGQLEAGETRRHLRDDCGFAEGALDFVFLDHDKEAYLPDLLRIEEEGWLHPGSVVVADNIKFPGAPAYHSHMKEAEGLSWRTVEHATHVEYQTMMKDLVLESTYLGTSG